MPSTGTARILLATVVLGTIATTGTVALTLPQRAAADVDIPEFPTTAAAAAPVAAPVTGADIAAPVLEPQRERAGGARPRSDPEPAEGTTIPGPDDAIWDELSERMRQSVREACAADRLDGPVCTRA